MKKIVIAIAVSLMTSLASAAGWTDSEWASFDNNKMYFADADMSRLSDTGVVGLWIMFDNQKPDKDNFRSVSFYLEVSCKGKVSRQSSIKKYYGPMARGEHKAFNPTAFERIEPEDFQQNIYMAFCEK